jgi:DnaJ-class molecular chaperone
MRLSDWRPAAGHRWAMCDVKGFRMKTRVANPTEQRCPACNGSGVLAVIQLVQPGRRIYPPPCGECDGKGRIPKAEE